MTHTEPWAFSCALGEILGKNRKYIRVSKDLPGGSVVKNPAANAVDTGSIPGLGNSPGEGSGTSLEYSCLGNPMDRGARQATVHGVAKQSDMT